MNFQLKILVSLKIDFSIAFDTISRDKGQLLEARYLSISPMYAFPATLPPQPSSSETLPCSLLREFSKVNPWTITTLSSLALIYDCITLT